MLPPGVIHRGAISVPAPPEFVRAGPLTARYEPDGIFLRHIRLGDREVLRGIYVAVRDHNWNTITPVASSLEISTGDDSFSIEVEVRCNEREVDFVWRGTISGSRDGTITYSMTGEALSSFQRNRIGILVLHPPEECAGQPCVIESPDGERQELAFPDSISPHQPFFNIRAMTHGAKPGVRAEIRFSGDVFETEDQRNWTDASYKTYSTPLALPYPVHVEAGTTVSQSVELRMLSDVPSVESDESNHSIRLSPTGDEPIRIPPIGLGVSAEADMLADRQTEWLSALDPSHLRVDLYLSSGACWNELERAIQQATAVGCELQVALFLDSDAQSALLHVVDRLRDSGIGVSEWLILAESEKVASRKWVEIARPVIRERFPNAVIGSGTAAYFTELNRERPDTELLDVVCYSINPQVHAFDDLSLMETLEAQSWTVDSARRFVDGRGISVGPITLRPRFNPNATGPEASPNPGELPDSVDPRQMSLLGAGWTLGSLKYIAQSNVSSGTWFETIGWKGVMERESGSPLPDLFRSLPGSVFPLYHVLADFGEFADGEIVPLRSSDPLRADGCMLQTSDKRALLIANLTPDEQHIEVPWQEDMPEPDIRIIDDTNAERAGTDPDSFRDGSFGAVESQDGIISVTLNPFAYARISGIQQN